MLRSIKADKASKLYCPLVGEQCTKATEEPATQPQPIMQKLSARIVKNREERVESSWHSKIHSISSLYMSH
jgi:hypothetical protein